MQCCAPIRKVRAKKEDRPSTKLAVAEFRSSLAEPCPDQLEGPTSIIYYSIVIYVQCPVSFSKTPPKMPLPRSLSVGNFRPPDLF